MKTTTFKTTIPMQTCYLAPNPNGKHPIVDHTESWDFIVPDWLDKDKDYYRNALNTARSMVGERWDDDEAEGSDTRTYFRIDPMNPDHADLVAVWADMVYGSFVRFSTNNTARYEKVRKLDWASREDLRSVAIVSFYTEYCASMHEALHNALNAIDRYIYSLRQKGNAEYNPDFKTHNLPTPHGSLSAQYRDKADNAIADCISRLSPEHQLALDYVMDGVSITDTAKAIDKPRSTAQRLRYRAFYALMEEMEKSPDYWYIMEKMAVVETDPTDPDRKTIRLMDDDFFVARLAHWLESARKAKGKK